MRPTYDQADDIQVYDELERLLPKLTAEEQDNLERQLLANGGPDDSLVVWMDEQDGEQVPVLLDGHNRMRLCDEHELPFSCVVEPAVTSIDEARQWILTNQLSRRNLLPNDRAALVGRIYNEQKRDPGRPAKRSQSDTVSGDDDKRSQSDTVSDESPDAERTRERLAKEAGMSPQSVARAGTYAAALDSLADDCREAIETRLVKSTQHDVQRLAALPADIREYAETLIAAGEVKTVGQAIEQSVATTEDHQTPVEQSLAKVELLKPYHDKMQQLASNIRREMTEAIKDGNRWLEANRQTVETACREIRRVAKLTAPDSACGRCQGEGCETCLSCGWLSVAGADREKRGA